MENYVETSEALLKNVIKPRRLDSHKGDNGVVGIVGGSRIFHGAPFFSSIAALRTGADLAYLAVPNLIATPLRSLAPELIVFPLADSKLTRGAASALLKWLPKIDSLVIGPGIGRQNLDGVKKIVSDVCLERKVRVSLDAEAQSTDVYTFVKGKDCVSTPHPGEFKRVFQVEAGNSLVEKISSVKSKAKDYGITLVLKGHESIITDGDQIFVNRTGGAAMTCGGIGDTLSGVIGAMLAKNKDSKSVELAATASFVVGRAGQLAESVKGFHITSTDIIAEIPNVLKPFDTLAK